MCLLVYVGIYVYTHEYLYLEAREQLRCHYSGTIHLLFFCFV